MLPLLLPASPIAFELAAVGSLWLVSIAILSRQVRMTPLLASTILLICAVNPATLDALAVGQVTPFIAAGVGAMWLWPRYAAWVWVLGGLVKVFPAVGLVWTIRMGGSVGRPIAVGLVLVVVSAVWVGGSSWPDFVTALRNGRPTRDSGLPSLACSFAGGSVLAYLIAAALLVMVLRARRDEVAFFLLAVAMVIPAPDLFPNYLLVPAIGALPLIGRLYVSRVDRAHADRGPLRPVLGSH